MYMHTPVALSSAHPPLPSRRGVEALGWGIRGRARTSGTMPSQVGAWGSDRCYVRAGAAHVHVIAPGQGIT